MQGAVFQEVPIDYIECELWHEVTKEKAVQHYLHSLWEVWYEESITDGKKKISLFAKHVGPIFSRKYKIASSIINVEDPVGYKIMEIDNLDETHVIEVELEKDDDIYDVVCFDVHFDPMHYISPIYNHANQFSEESRPRNVVVKCNGFSFNFNKVVLALWSNYFDKEFFLTPENEEITEYTIEDINSNSLCKLFNMCLQRCQEFHRIRTQFSVHDVETAYTLQFTVPWNLIKGHKNFESIYFWRFADDLMKGIKLADKFNLTELMNMCARSFCSHDEENKKKFFITHEENIKKLSLNTIHHFLTKGQSFERNEYVTNTLVLPEPKEPEEEWEISEYGVNSRQDVCLLVGEERFLVHKEYLAFWSPYFDRLFFGNFIEKERTEVEIREVDPQEFGTLLRLIYTPGDLRLDDTNVAFLLKLADRFGMKSVMAMCSTYLTEMVTETESHDKIMDALEMADSHFLVDAQISCFNKMHSMNSKDSRKFRWDNRQRLVKLSENTRNNMFLLLSACFVVLLLVFTE